MMSGMSQASPATRTLHLVAVHIVARARQQAVERFSLRVTPAGFGTPEFGADSRRVRVSNGTLIVERDASGAPSSVAREIHGASLRVLAALAAVDLEVALDVGHDTPELGDPDQPLELDDTGASDVADWFRIVAAALDRVVATVPPAAGASLARVWPEHFDVAIDVATQPGVRVNLGGTPGDSFDPEPYLYVGPWTDDRPGDGDYWNAPFGAALARSQLDPGDPVTSATAFLLDGFRRLKA
jgi:hypothetical protein